MTSVERLVHIEGADRDIEKKIDNTKGKLRGKFLEIEDLSGDCDFDHIWANGSDVRRNVDLLPEEVKNYLLGSVEKSGNQVPKLMFASTRGVPLEIRAVSFADYYAGLSKEVVLAELANKVDALLYGDKKIKMWKELIKRKQKMEAKEEMSLFLGRLMNSAETLRLIEEIQSEKSEFEQERDRLQTVHDEYVTRMGTVVRKEMDQGQKKVVFNEWKVRLRDIGAQQYEHNQAIRRLEDVEYNLLFVKSLFERRKDFTSDDLLEVFDSVAETMTDNDVKDLFIEAVLEWSEQIPGKPHIKNVAGAGKVELLRQRFIEVYQLVQKTGQEPESVAANAQHAQLILRRLLALIEKYREDFKP